MGRMSEHYIEVMNMNDMDGWNQFEEETHERLCELIASLQQYMTTEDLSLLCWATGVSKTHIASKPEIDAEEVQAAEEQSLEYFDRYIAGDRK